MHLPLCIIAAEANKQHRKSTSKVKGEEGQANKKISCGCRGESHGRIFLVGRIFLCSYNNKHSSSAFSAVVSLLLFCCCCLIFVCVYLAFDLRLCLHEDHDEDQDEDQDDKTKIKTAMNTKIKHTHLVIITEATLVILDLNLRRALLLYEDAAATAAPDRASLRQWIAWR